MRAIELRLPDEWLNATEKTRKRSQDAVGYLCCWAHASPSYCKLKLSGDSEGNLHASYSDANGEQTYFIYGQRQSDGFYSFHS